VLEQEILLRQVHLKVILEEQDLVHQIELVVAEVVLLVQDKML
jgi:hypothetical protein